MLFASFYCGVFAYNVIPDKNLLLIAHLDLLLIFIMFATVGSAHLYVYSLIKDKAMSTDKQILLYMPALLNFSISAVLFFLTGVDQVINLHLQKVAEVEHLPFTGSTVAINTTQERLEKAYWFFAESSVKIQLLLMVVLLMGLSIYAIRKQGYKLGRLSAFLFRGKPIKSSALTLLALILLCAATIFYILVGRTFVAHNYVPGLLMSILLATCMFVQSHVEYFNSNSYITLKSFFNNDLFNQERTPVTNTNAESVENVETEEVENGVEEVSVEAIEESKEEETDKQDEESTELNSTDKSTSEEESAKEIRAEEINIEGLENLDPVSKEAMKGMLKSVLDYVPKKLLTDEDIEKEVAEFRRRKAEQNSRSNKEGARLGTALPTDEKMQKLCDMLRDLIEEKHVYLDATLNRDSLAAMMKSNRTWVTLAIKEVYGTSIINLLTQKRLEAVKEHLMNNPDDTMDSIAHSCGFRDGSALCHKFRAAFGISPKAWVEERLKELKS